ncbi:unnamed protein product [Prunus armeniaca]
MSAIDINLLRYMRLVPGCWNYQVFGGCSHVLQNGGYLSQELDSGDELHNGRIAERSAWGQCWASSALSSERWPFFGKKYWY